MNMLKIGQQRMGFIYESASKAVCTCCRRDGTAGEHASYMHIYVRTRHGRIAVQDVYAARVPRAITNFTRS